MGKTTGRMQNRAMSGIPKHPLHPPTGPVRRGLCQNLTHHSACTEDDSEGATSPPWLYLNPARHDVVD
eukprot:460408-Rhodomonas_salina.3